MAGLDHGTPSIASLARDFADRIDGPLVSQGSDLAQLARLVAALADCVAATDPFHAPDSPEPPAMLTIRRCIESCEDLALDDESDREVIIGRLARALGIA